MTRFFPHIALNAWKFLLWYEILPVLVLLPLSAAFAWCLGLLGWKMGEALTMAASALYAADTAWTLGLTAFLIRRRLMK